MGEQRSRSAMGKHVHDVLFINELKHMDKGDDGSVVMDVEECALASILVALANFVTLRGRGTRFVEAFFLWVKQNLDPAIYNVDCRAFPSSALSGRRSCWRWGGLEKRSQRRQSRRD
jgi:hypothetical protein